MSRLAASVIVLVAFFTYQGKTNYRAIYLLNHTYHIVFIVGVKR